MQNTDDYLIQKFLKNELSREEAIQLKDWLAKPENKEKLKDDIQLNHLINTWLQGFDTEKAYEENKQLRKNKNKSIKKFQPYRLMKYAAVFTALLGIGYFFYNQSGSNSKQLNIPEESIVLEFEDGGLQNLVPGKKQVITSKTGATVSIKQGDTLLYTNSNYSASIYHTLKVPYGKTHKLILADGSFVHLNAGSQLRFPTNFKGETRTVYLTGEAYFEVSHNETMPFVVTTENIDIRVFGTTFNVSAYSSDLTTETVLLEGSVALTGEQFESKFLRPGEMGSWDIQKEDLEIKQVETYDYIAWTKGELLFHKKPFKEILKVLERKYNVGIENNYPELNNGRYKAKFDEESIQEVMETFAESRLFDYHIKNNKIIIEKPEEQ
jgi:hypothetical protein